MRKEKLELKKINDINFKDVQEETHIGGRVKEVTIYGKGKFAKKELKQFDHKSLQRFLLENEPLIQFRHPCIVDIIGFDYGDAQHPPSIYLALEPTSLVESIQRPNLTPEEKNRIIVEIVLGMRYIHSNKLIHRDLKPSNILLSKNKHVRISDFGLAKEESLETAQSKGICTLRFMAPELFEEDDEKGYCTNYTNKVDVYSFGIILICILTEEYPRYKLSDILNGVLPTLPTSIVSWVAELVRRCLQFSPNDRPTFSDIFNILKSHNFDLFNEDNTDKPTIQQRRSKEEIEHRILKIEAFEYQVKLS